ncbi:hypothetical protein [Enterococcus avium]|uniref:hypothetical protein n=1 Tax=Enterococcus avium TaxID=33945 RepID=UPI001F57777F|nr:hypothetical protein [Enterococcus avium]
MAHYETYEELLRSSEAPVQGKKLKVKEQMSEGTKPADSGEIANRKRWFALKDGTMVEVKKGEAIPAADLREKSVTQAQYQAWLEEQDDGEESVDEKSNA